MTSPWSHLWRWCLGVSGVSALVVLAGGSATWAFERDADGGNLRHWDDCLWWAMTTLCTVGYGEHYPVTGGGRVVAILIMVFGVVVIGAVAAIVAFGFASRLATRLEAAVAQVESQVEQVEAEVQYVEDEVGARRRLGRRHPAGGLQELVVSLPDSDCAASLTWLLARLGWHPTTADGADLGWGQGGVVLRLAVRPWATPVGVQGRLTFGAGTAERLARIARESGRHGFRAVQRASPSRRTATPGPAGSAERAAEPDDEVVLRTVSGFEVVLVVS